MDDKTVRRCNAVLRLRGDLGVMVCRYCGLVEGHSGEFHEVAGDAAERVGNTKPYTITWQTETRRLDPSPPQLRPTFSHGQVVSSRERPPLVIEEG